MKKLFLISLLSIVSINQCDAGSVKKSDTFRPVVRYQNYSILVQNIQQNIQSTLSNIQNAEDTISFAESKANNWLLIGLSSGTAFLGIIATQWDNFEFEAKFGSLLSLGVTSITMLKYYQVKQLIQTGRLKLSEFYKRSLLSTLNLMKQTLEYAENK